MNNPYRQPGENGESSAANNAKPFQSSPECEKCGYATSMHFIDYDASTDLLHVSCLKCSYKWLMRPKGPS